MATLYRRLLGSAFDGMPDVLRSFHDRPEGGKACGEVRVTRGTTRLARTIATLAGFPPEGDSMPLTVEVLVSGERESWIRSFGSHIFSTAQWVKNGRLVERSGAMNMVFEVKASSRGMHFRSISASMVFVPLPMALVPRAEVDAIGDEAGWSIDVRIEAAGVGPLVRYQGRVRPV